MKEPDDARQPSPARKRLLKKDLLEKVASLEGQVAQLREEAEKTQEALEQERDRLLRAIAQERNLRNHAAKEEGLRLNVAKAQILSSFFPPLDNLELALGSKEENWDSLHQGVEIIMRQLKEVLASQGIVEVNPLHQPFDPAFHEAVGTTSDAELPEGTVAAVQRRGFLVNGQLLRPAQVVVVAKPPEAAEEEAS